MSRTANCLTMLGLCLIVLVAAVPFTCIYLDRRYARDLAREFAQMKADGLPVSLADLTPRPVPDSQNAALIYVKVFGLKAVNGQLQRAGTPSALDGLNWQGSPRDSDFATWAVANRALLATPAVRGALARLRQASLMPYCVFPGTPQPLEQDLHLQYRPAREATRAVACQAVITARDGDLPAALDWLAVGYRMVHHLSAEPLLIGYLVTVAMQGIMDRAAQDVLDRADLSAELARPLYDVVSRLDHRRAFTTALHGELAMGLDHFARQRQDMEQRVAARRSRHPGMPRLSALPLARSYMTLEEITYVREMRRSTRQMDQPFRQLQASPREEPRARPGGYLAAMMVPVFARANVKRDMAMANQALLMAALALKAHRHETGHYPKTLAALKWPVPLDPFTGRALVYKPQGQGFVAYSLGPDLKDDGGAAFRYKDQTGDLVWRMAR
jgi:hypothetical protein